MDYSYQYWKEEKSIDLVCDKLLDNADMNIEFSSYPLSVKLTFFIIGSDIKIIFSCKNIELLKLDKESDDEALFVILETHVVCKNKKWEITLFPNPEITIHCNKFNWSIGKMTESERNM